MCSGLSAQSAFSNCAVASADGHPSRDRCPEVQSSASASLSPPPGPLGSACCPKGLCGLSPPHPAAPEGGRTTGRGGRVTGSLQPASMEPAGFLHTESVTCQIIARSRKENRNIQCRQFTKYDSRLVWKQGPCKAFSFPVSFSSAEQLIQSALRPGGERREGERAFGQDGGFLPGLYCHVLWTGPAGGAPERMQAAPGGQGQGPTVQGAGGTDNRAHPLSQIGTACPSVTMQTHSRNSGTASSCSRARETSV